ncbi:Clp protease N-terminal domain-containing protein [Isoptericola halotolerans]|uniref:Clp protease N-terminal domain-containing protein n=1 Tax=Isoptericola halotolerans TaxID=300560 RepID=UPI003890F05A
MFERFSKEARSAVVAAQLVARQTRTTAIDTRHLLVALAEATGPASSALADVGLDPDAVAAAARRELTTGDLDPAALAAVGIDLTAVREQTDATFGRGALDRAGDRTRRGHVPFAPDAKTALELALREAVRLGDRTIGGGHLLLGILRADCPAGRLLERALHGAGTDTATLRSAVEHRRAA